MTIGPIDARSALVSTLQQAIAGYGADLLLAVPRATAPSASTSAGGEAAASSSPTPVASAASTSTATSARTPPPASPERASAAIAPATKATERPNDRATWTAPPTATEAPTPAAANADPLHRLKTEVIACRKCKLCESRKTVVFGEGTRTPEVMFVGEAPGAVEDQTGRPFVGPAGQLLDRILDGAMGLRREDVFIANVNKCRPPGNRDPEPDEVAACLPYLRQQVELLQPKVLVALGRVAAHNLLDTQAPMRELRGRELHYMGIPVVVTWHPAYLLRDPSRKVETWADIKRVNRLLGRPEDPRRTPPAEA